MRVVMSSSLELMLLLMRRTSIASLKLATTPLVPDLVLGACLSVGMLISGSMSSSKFRQEYPSNHRHPDQPPLGKNKYMHGSLHYPYSNLAL